jgi:hypothetical protein
MKITAWDKVISSSPLNKDAAIARDGGGTSWTPERALESSFVRSHAPMPMKAPDHTWRINLTGTKVGKLTVLGVADFPARKSGAAWVVRCVCGYYETRKAKTLRDPVYAERAACSECEYVAELKAGRVKLKNVAERTQKA